MPTYEYECERCSLRFELKRRFNESSEVSCPRRQGKVRQVFSPVPIIFKGPGFYVTDNMTEGRGGYGSGWGGDHATDVGKMIEPAGENKNK